MPVHGKGVLVIIVPQDVVLVRAPLAEVIRMDDDSHPGFARVLQDGLTPSCGAVNQHDVLLRQRQPGHHISHELLLRADELVWELIHHLPVIIDFLIRYTSVFIEEPAQVHVRFVVQGCVVFREQPTVCKIVLPNQVSPGDDFHPVDTFRLLVHKVDRIVVVLSGEDNPSGFSVPAVRMLLCRKRPFQILQHIRDRRNPIVCKKAVQPDDLRVQEPDVLRQMLDVLRCNHVREYEPGVSPDIPKHDCPIALGVLHAAGCPAYTKIKVVNHLCPMSPFPLLPPSCQGNKTNISPALLYFLSPRNIFLTISLLIVFSMRRKES